MKTLKIFIKIILAIAIIYLGLLLYFRTKDPIIKWNWRKINTSEINFPKDFMWGVATAAHQVEGGHQDINNWGWWEKQSLPEGGPTIAGGQKSGLADDNWHRYLSDIQLMRKLGVNAYRFSVSWSKIMPTPDSIDKSALRHYQIMCDTLEKYGITPVVTLFHYTYPLWFQDSGAFEYEKNIKYFVEFSQQVYKALHTRVKYWCTINEPVVFAYSSYFSGEYPPGKRDPQLTAKVLANLLKAHVKVYYALKAMPDGRDSKIGIVKNITQMDPYRKWNLADNIIAYFADLNFNESVLKAFSTGTFRFYMPTMVNYKENIQYISKSLDFIGLNYYSHYAFKFNKNLDAALTPLPYPGETMTDMDYGIYPEGIYRAIKRISKLGVPIIITENGIADSLDNRRGMFIKQSLYAVSKAIKDGYDVRGYFYWSLMDNFEWNLGFSKRFGLYKVDYKTLNRTLRKSAQEYINIIREARK